MPKEVTPDFTKDTCRGENPAEYNALDEMPMHAQRKQPPRINAMATDLLTVQAF